MASTTIAKMVYRVRMIGRDFSATEPIRSLPETLDALDRAVFDVSGKLPGYVGQNSTIITLVAGTNGYNLTGEYHTLNAFQIASDGAEVVKVSPQSVMKYRQGNPTAQGQPVIIAFVETAAGVARAEVWPTPVEADTVIGLRALVPSHTFQGKAGTDLTSTSLDFGVYGTDAIAYLAAAYLYPDERDLNMRLSADALLAEKYRIARQRQGSTMGRQV